MFDTISILMSDPQTYTGFTFDQQLYIDNENHFFSRTHVPEIIDPNKK